MLYQHGTRSASSSQPFEGTESFTCLLTSHVTKARKKRDIANAITSTTNSAESVERNGRGKTERTTSSTPILNATLPI
jgi:hypothetical protein